MMPLWLDPTPLTRAFVGSFANAPVREVSQAHEFRAARLEFDEEKRVEREQRVQEALARKRAGIKKSADRRLLKVLADCKPGETVADREKRKKREDYARKKDYYAAKYRARKLAKLAAQGCAVERLKA